MNYTTHQKNLDILHGRVSRLNRTIKDFQEQIDSLLRCIDAMNEVMIDEQVQMAEDVSKEHIISVKVNEMMGNNGEPLPKDRESEYDGYKEEHNF